MRKLLGKLLFFAVLEMGALAGVPMSPEEIERLMEVMNRAEVVQVMEEHPASPISDRAACARKEG